MIFMYRDVKAVNIIACGRIMGCAALQLNREEGLEAWGVAKLFYCCMSRDNTSA